MYCIELALKLSPFPLSVQRKELRKAQNLYQEIKSAIENGQPRILEISCEKLENKKIAVLVSEILAVQMYEKTAAAAGSKRPGFSFDN